MVVLLLNHCLLLLPLYVGVLCLVLVLLLSTFRSSGFAIIMVGMRAGCFTLIVVVVGFVALRPKSTAMVIAGRSVHLTTLFPGQA